MRWDIWALILVLPLAGCTSSKKADRQSFNYPAATAPRSSPAPAKPPKAPQVIVTPASGETGKIASVNQEGHFVVVTYALGNVPKANRRLNVYRGGLKVGEIKIGGMVRDNNAIADIVAGECQPGDEVKEE